jgi:hypothetical protein
MTKELKSHYKNLRDWFILAYVVMFLIGRFISIAVSLPWSVVIPIDLIQVAVGLTGCYYWTKYKGRNPWLTVLGIFGPLGWLVLMLLKDKATITETQTEPLQRD